jgi:hypothetical protein
MTVAARISCIVARAAPVVAVFRRGPSKQVALLEWNLATNGMALGQWMKGQIHMRRADLSPDGRHLIYFASNQRRGHPLGGTWTAVSRMPHLRALHLYGWGHSWNGGGLFIDNATYWLNQGGPALQGAVGKIECGLQASALAPQGVRPVMGEDPVTYVPRLLRDGWVLMTQGPDGRESFAMTFHKRIRAGWTLEKTFRMGVKAGPLGEAYHELHSLIGPRGATDFAAEWADVWKHDVLWATGGCLWRQAVHAKVLGDAVIVADLNHMRFQAIEAPYAGVGPGDLRGPA